MKRLALASMLIFGCLLAVTLDSLAQQSSAHTTPKLTSDDVAKSRSRTGGTVVLSAVDPNKWTKFTPGGLRLSIELPGGLDPRELPVPDYVMNELHREYSDAKFFVGLTSTMSVSLLYLPSNKLSVTPADLKAKATQFMKVIATVMDSNAKYRAELAGKSTVSVGGSYRVGGESFEMVGSMQARGKDIWLVTSVYRQPDEASRATARRVIGSVTLY